MFITEARTKENKIVELEETKDQLAREVIYINGIKKRLYYDGTIECLSEKNQLLSSCSILLDDVPSIINFIDTMDRKSNGVKNILKYQ